MFETTARPTLEQQPRWWTEREMVLILFIATITFCVRLDALPLFGEEPRRALIAREMVESGDWLVPGTQRVFLASRPPLQNWMIACIGLMTGSFDVWAARIPSVFSVLRYCDLDVWLSSPIYGSAREPDRRGFIPDHDLGDGVWSIR